MMKSLLAVVPFLCITAICAHSDDTRINILKRSNLIKTMQQDDKWNIMFTPTTIGYACATCTPPVSGLISVHTVKPDAYGPTPILEARKKHCAELVLKPNNRCITSAPFQMRVGGINGFRFEDETTKTTIVRLQFPYKQAGSEPELIKATIIRPRDTQMPEDFEQTLLNHMLRLTMWY